MEIKQEIRYAFEAERHITRLSDIRAKMSQMIQLSPAELIVELVFHYNTILDQLVIYHPRQYDVETPVALSIRERVDELNFLREDGDPLTRQLLFSHEELMDQIIVRREKELDTLEKNVMSHLELLCQQIKQVP